MMVVANGIGKSAKGSRRYLPQKNSVAYALLITLYRFSSCPHSVPSDLLLQHMSSYLNAVFYFPQGDLNWE